MAYTTDFINEIASGAQASQQSYGVLASVTIAQAILESGWGSSGLSKSPYYNVFGIKAEDGYQGTKELFPTREYIDGQWVTVQAYFRTYTSRAASISDHGAFLYNNNRYDNLIGDTDYVSVCNKLHDDGYATDPTYANQLISLIEKYGLHQYDNVEYTGTVPYSQDNLSTNSMTIREIQQICNNIGITDGNGQRLIVDGKLGVSTQGALYKLGTLVRNILS